ncbi:uncharacterized protein LOC116342017 [Contarinia nasturtii]|uniref:uncharacterized protein LOC116342017 n=1 Tax=Contarinia nasturtii TaxID=265458 RepID=UPI0012D3DF47|nr:uncharacterized protein LOC116342017 [Contarinia nasturtii]
MASKIVLTDLNFDCLEGLLKYLSLGDLLKLADSNATLHQFVKIILIQKYGTSLVLGYHRFQRYLCTCNNDLAIDNLKMSLQLFRCFGSQISHLSLTFKEKFEKNGNAWNNHLIDYINTYCTESLQTLELNGIQKIVPYHLKKPFPNVENVYIEDCFFNDLDERNSICSLFPKLTNLTLVYKWMEDGNSKYDPRIHGTFKFIAKHYPFLECFQFGVCFGFHTFKTDLIKKSLLHAIRLNPQLKVLDISITKCPLVTLGDLQKVSNSLQCLEHLKLVIATNSVCQ